MKSLIAVVGIIFLLSSTSAAAQPDRALGEAGQWSLGGSAGVSYAAESGLGESPVISGGPDRGSRELSLWVSPRASVFVLDRLSLALSATWEDISWQESQDEEDHVRILGLSLGVGYCAPLSDAVYVWPQLSVGVAVAEQPSEFTDTTDVSPAAAAYLPLVFVPGDALFIGAGPYLRVRVATDDEVLGTFSSTTLGLSTTIGTFF